MRRALALTLALRLPFALPSCTLILWSSAAVGSAIQWETVETESHFVATEIRVRSTETVPERFWLRLAHQGGSGEQDGGPSRWLAIEAERADLPLPRTLSALLTRAEGRIESAVVRSTDLGDGQVWFGARANFVDAAPGEADPLRAPSSDPATPEPIAVTVPLAASWVEGPSTASELLWIASEGDDRVPLTVVHTNRRRQPRGPSRQRSNLILLATPFTLALDAVMVGVVLFIVVEAGQQAR